MVVVDKVRHNLPSSVAVASFDTEGTPIYEMEQIKQRRVVCGLRSHTQEVKRISMKRYNCEEAATTQ